MKPRLCQFWVATLAVAMVLLTGCETKSTASYRRMPAKFTATVIESSTDRELTLPEMSRLRAGAAAFLESQPALGPGDYYVRVDLTPGLPAAEAEWAIVRLRSAEEPTYALLPSYPPDGYRNGGDEYGDEEYPDFTTYSTSYGYYDPSDYYYPGYRRPVRRYHHDDDHSPDHRPHGREGDDRDHDHHDGKPGDAGQDDHRPRGHDDHATPAPGSPTGDHHGDANKHWTYDPRYSRVDRDGNARPDHDNRGNGPRPADNNRPHDAGSGARSQPAPAFDRTSRGSSPAPSSPPAPARSAPAPAPSNNDNSRNTRDAKAN